MPSGREGVDWLQLFAIRDAPELSVRVPVQMSDLYTKEVVYKWSSAEFAAKKMECKNRIRLILNGCFGSLKSALGFEWCDPCALLLFCTLL